MKRLFRSVSVNAAHDPDLRTALRVLSALEGVPVVVEPSPLDRRDLPYLPFVKEYYRFLYAT